MELNVLFANVGVLFLNFKTNFKPVVLQKHIMALLLYYDL